LPVEVQQPVVSAAPKVETRNEPPPGWLPAWRVREMVEAERRKARSQPEPIDPYVDPEKFRDAGVKAGSRSDRTAVVGHAGILLAEVGHCDARPRNRAGSLQVAGNRHHAGDPKVGPLLQRVTSSIDPFEDVVTAFKRDKALSTVGDDPNAWFEKEFERRAASDPAFKDKLAALQGGQQQQQNGAAPTKRREAPAVP
jgi:hypothetical protein